MGLPSAFGATDRNQRQTPPLPRNEGVRGSHPRVGFRKSPLRWDFLVWRFRSGEAIKRLLLSLVGPRLAPQNTTRAPGALGTPGHAPNTYPLHRTGGNTITEGEIRLREAAPG